MKNNSFLSFVRYMLSKTKKKINIFVLIFLSLLASLCSLISATFSKNIINNVFVGLDVNYLYAIAPTILIVYCFSSFITVAHTYLNTLISTKFANYVRLDFFDKLQKASYHYLCKLGANDLYYRIFQDTSIMVSYFFSVIVALPVRVLTVIITSFLMFHWSPELTLLALGFTIVQISFVLAFRRPVRDSVSKLRKTEQELASRINEHFKVIDSIKIFGLENQSYFEFKSKFNELNSVTLKNSMLGAFYGVVINLLNQIWIFFVLVMGARLTLANTITIGNFMGVYMLSNTLYSPLAASIETILKFQETSVSFNRYKEYYQKYNENEYTGDMPFSFQHHIEVTNLSFSYDNINYVIQNLSFDLQKNSIVLLQGESGTGKTTLAKLLARLLYPSSGMIKIDNIDICNFTNHSLRAGICFLTQTPIIINDTIINNVFINRTPNRGEFYSLMREVGLSDLVSALPDKENTLLGINGYDLSGGEKQRLSLARTLLQSPDILILDEPTSFLDEKNKQIVLGTIQRYQKSTRSLVFIISHDNIFNNISNCIITFHTDGSIRVKFVKNDECNKV